MTELFQQRLELLSSPEANHQLTGIQRGIEKESLRISKQAALSTTAHPAALGSALTHSCITTDFSEALLEFITPVSTSIEQSLAILDDIHRFTYENLDSEHLWASSMPCELTGDNSIPIARYGSSNTAQMKQAYRRGLVHRYGATMQTIAGIHYNFSLPENLWGLLQRHDQSDLPRQQYIDQSYFNIIRNFQRMSWLLVYLFGASPAVDKSFINGKPHNLSTFDENTLYLPYATSLRMGDLGYQSSIQNNLNISYNSLDSFIETLNGAIVTPHPAYEKTGLKLNGEYRQLSTSLLQIENEFYSSIRPKQVTRPGETPLSALHSRGVEYIEVRCIDVNPFLPLGIDAEQIKFLDIFLLYCLLTESPQFHAGEQTTIRENLKRVVNEGRKPDLSLRTVQADKSMASWGGELLKEMAPLATHLDHAHGSQDYNGVLQHQREKLAASSLTPSEQVLTAMSTNQQSFMQLSQTQSEKHADYFLGRPLKKERIDFFTDEARHSFLKQSEIESTDSVTFEEYLQRYYNQYT